MKDKNNVSKGTLIKKKIVETKNNEMKLNKKLLIAIASYHGLMELHWRALVHVSFHYEELS
jgi:hypothetical protein